MTAGQVIGLSGYSPAARSVGAHLHYELRDAHGNLLDPAIVHGFGQAGPTGEGLGGRQVFAGRAGSYPKGTAAPPLAQPAQPANITTLKTRRADADASSSLFDPDLDQGRKALDQANRPREIKGKGEVTVKVAPTKNQMLANRFKHVPIKNMQVNEHAERGPSHDAPPSHPRPPKSGGPGTHPLAT